MQCPFRIQMCCSLLGNGESGEAGRVQSGDFSWYCRSYYMRLSLTHTHARHTHVGWGFFLRRQELLQQHASQSGHLWFLLNVARLHAPVLDSSHRLCFRHHRWYYDSMLFPGIPQVYCHPFRHVIGGRVVACGEMVSPCTDSSGSLLSLFSSVKQRKGLCVFGKTCWASANLAVTADMFHRPILQVFPIQAYAGFVRLHLFFA